MSRVVRRARAVSPHQPTKPEEGPGKKISIQRWQAWVCVLAALLEEVVHQRLRGVLRTIYFIPATISITVAGILFSFLYNPQIGLLNRALTVVGLGALAQDWLGNPQTAIFAVIGMSQWQS